MEPGCHYRRHLCSDVADVRQHLVAEQIERFHQLVGMFRARGLEKQIDDAAADLFTGLFQVRDDLVRPAVPAFVVNLYNSRLSDTLGACMAAERRDF